MDTIRNVLGRIGVQTPNSAWVTWPPQASAEPEVLARDQVTVGCSAASQAAVPERPWSALQRLGLVETGVSTSSAAAAAVTGGALGAALTAETRTGLLNVLRSLEGEGIRLAQCQPASNRNPAKYRPMAPEEALGWLESQPATFSNSLSGYSSARQPVAVSSLTDVMVLDALHGPAGAAQAPNAPLAEALRSLEAAGWSVSVPRSDASADPLQAYTSLQAPSRDAVGLVGPYRTAWVRTAEEVVAIDFFEGSRTDRGLSQPVQAATLRSLGDAAYTFTTVDAQGRSAVAPASDAYMSLQTGGRVVLKAPDSKVAFYGDPALLSSPDLVRERAEEISGLYQAHVLPILGESHLDRPVDQANFFASLYNDLGRMPREEACKRLAALTKATFFSALPVFNEIMGAASMDGNVDGRITDYGRICKVSMPDADRLPAFHYMERNLRDMACADVPYTALHDTFLHLLERTHSLQLACKAVEVCTLPAGGLDFESRAECLVQVAAGYDSECQNQLVSDYVALVNPPPRDASPMENARNFAETFAPLRKAFGRSASLDDVRQAHEALALVSLRVADETQAQRTEIMLGLDREDAIEIYRTLLLHRVPGESLAETADRFAGVAAGLSSTSAQDRALDVFRTLQDSFRRNPDLDRAEVTSRVFETLALSSDVEAALAAATQPVRVAGTITGDAATLTIGGVRIQRNTSPGDVTP